MSELLSICSSEIGRSLLIWVPILVGSVMLLGIAIFALCRARFRHLASTSRTPASRTRVWIAGVLLIGTQAVLLPALALVLATAFSLQRGAANAIESASPRILAWGMRMGTDAVEEKLSITDSTTIVDLGRLLPALRKIPPAADRARGFLKRLSIVRRFVADTYVNALNAAVAEAASADLQVTWSDLHQSAHRRFGGLWNAQARIVAAYLRVSSLDAINLLAGVVVGVDALCVLTILALTSTGVGPTQQRIQG